MSATSPTLVRVVVHGRELTPAEGMIGGVHYRCEHMLKPGVRVTMELSDRRRRVVVPGRQVGGLNAVASRRPGSHRVNIQFYGTDVDKLYHAVLATDGSNAAVAEVMQPFVQYLQTVEEV